MYNCYVHSALILHIHTYIVVATVQLSFNLTLACTTHACYSWILARNSRVILCYTRTHENNTAAMRVQAKSLASASETTRK